MTTFIGSAFCSATIMAFMTGETGTGSFLLVASLVYAITAV